MYPFSKSVYLQRSTHPQAAIVSEEKLVLSANKLIIKKNNEPVASDSKIKDSLLRLVVGILKHHKLYKPVSLTATVPVIYLHQFWKTITHNSNIHTFNFQLDTQTYTLTARLLRTVLQMPLPDANKPYTKPPTKKQILAFIKKLGYDDDPNAKMTSVSTFVATKLHQPWSVILSVLNRNAELHSKGQDSPLTMLMNTYYKHKKIESEKAKATEKPEEQHESPVKSGRGKGYMRLGDQEVNVPSVFKKNVMPKKTRSLTVADNILEESVVVELAKSISIEDQQRQQHEIMTQLTIDRQIEKDVKVTYVEWGQKYKGPVVKDPAIQSLLNLHRGSKECRLESLRKEKKPVKEEGSTKDDEIGDSNMDLSVDEPEGYDDAAGFGVFMYNKSTDPLKSTYFNGAPRLKKYGELTDEEKLQDDCDVKAINIILQCDDPITSLNKAMAFLTTAIASRYPSTNNQLRISSIPRNEATIQDGTVIIQKVQGRQGQSFASMGSKSNATSLVINKNGGNNAAGQARVIRCYNYQREGHMARQCTQPKRSRNSAWFKEKMLLVQAHEADYDEAPGAKAVLMTNLSGYESNVISKVPISEAIQDNYVFDNGVHETYYSEQPNFDLTSDIEFTSDSNIISYDQYLKETESTAVQNTASTEQPHGVIMSIFEEIPNIVAKYHAKSIQNKNVNESLTAEIERYKERVKLFEEWQKIDLNDREKYIEKQINDMILNRNAKFAAFQKEIDSLKFSLSKNVKDNESLMTKIDVLKTQSKEKEDKYNEKEIDVEKKIKELKNIVFKVGQSTQIKMPPKKITDTKTTTITPITAAQLKALIAQGVADALADRDADRSRNDDDNHDLGNSGRRQAPPTRECTYSDFLKCQPLNFKGSEGVVGLTQWFEKMESIFHISNCTVACQIKFATCTLQGNALTWWNSYS
ncbi:hypothetical protein Tco_0257142 [Tanacetum coccineum]